MKSWSRPARGLAALPFVLCLLAGCAAQSHGDAVTAAYCQHQADQIFEMRHPEQRYAEDTYTTSLRDAPFSTSGSPSLPTQGLGAAYEHGELERDCIRGTHGAGPTPAAPPAMPALAAPAGQP